MKKALKIILGISFILYLLIVMDNLFLSSRGHWSDIALIEYIKHSSNFIPFKTIIRYIKAIFDGSMNMDIPIKNLIGNLVLFLPMGIYLPFLLKKLDKVSRYSICMIVLLFAIEIVQLLTRRGSLDIDDFILNVLGASIGFMLWKTMVCPYTQRDVNLSK